MKKLTAAGLGTVGAAMMVVAMGCAHTEAPSAAGECRETNALFGNGPIQNGAKWNASGLNGVFGNGTKKQGSFLQGMNLNGTLLGNSPQLKGPALESDGVAIAEGEIVASSPTASRV